MFLFNRDPGENFIGREKEIDYITQHIRMSQNVLVTGPRRMGKTTLAKEIINRLKERNFFTAYLEILPVSSINHLSSEIVGAVLENLNLRNEFYEMKSEANLSSIDPELKIIVDDYDFLLGFRGKSVDNYELLGNCLDFIERFSVRHKKRMVCVFDEFGDIKKLDDGRLVELFKSRIRKHINTSYFFTGSYESVMSSLFEEAQSPFNRFATKLRIGEIDEQDFMTFYERQFGYYHIPFPDKLVIRILDLTRGHPFYTQLALQEIIIYHLANEKIPDFDVLIRKMIHAEKDYLEKSWEEIATSKQNIKTILAVTKGVNGVYSSLRNSNVNIYRSLKMLVGNGTLTVNPDKTYRMSDPLLNFWIKQNVHRQDIRVT